jgi:hypothetical protein
MITMPYVDINFDRVLFVTHPTNGDLSFTIHFDNQTQSTFTWTDEAEYIEAVEALPV